ncbi:MAG TPA: VWA domain-containing protein [Candidatus Limnocylindrales bacterium]|nr:VWA domain-containing protein [Candidatus Limnocylindrales bacterium]
MTFLWGGLLVLLLAIPLLLAAYAWSRRRRRPAAARYSSVSLIRAAGPSRRRWRRHVPITLVAAAVAALAVAVARPTVVLSVPSSQSTMVLAMDVSGSMCSTDIEPTRLEAAQAAAIAFVEGQPSGTRIGLVAFSGFAAVLEVPTADHARVVEAIRSLTTGRRTAIGSGIQSSIDAIAEVDPNVAPIVRDGRPGVEPEAGVPGAYEPDIVVLLTDGANNAGTDPLEAAAQAASRGLRVYTIGYGTQAGAELQASCRRQFMGNEPPGGFGGGFGGGGGGGGGGVRRGIDEDTLKAIADLTGGTYSPAESATELGDVFANLPTTLITKREPVEVSVGFVALGGLLAAIGLLLGRAWRPLP